MLVKIEFLLIIKNLKLVFQGWLIIGSIDTPGYAYGVTLSTDGTKAFVADSYSSLQIVDITGL